MTSAAGRDSGGFSLLELILVLLLLGLSGVIVLPNIESGLRDRQVRASALALAAVARDLRSRAIDRGVPQRLTLDVRQNSYAALDREVQLPADVAFTNVRGGEAGFGDRRLFVFFPNGSSVGGVISLSGASDASYSVRLQALTGKIDVSRGQPS